jgi:hypothetical protein
MQSPAVAIPVVYYELWTIRSVSEVFKTLGERMWAFAAEIDSRSGEYWRLWTTLNQALQDVSLQLER